MNSMADNAPTQLRIFDSRTDETLMMLSTNAMAMTGISIHNQ